MIIGFIRLDTEAAETLMPIRERIERTESELHVVQSRAALDLAEIGDFKEREHLRIGELPEDPQETQAVEVYGSVVTVGLLTGHVILERSGCAQNELVPITHHIEAGGLQHDLADARGSEIRRGSGIDGQDFFHVIFSIK